jgi:hypothetical protein
MLVPGLAATIALARASHGVLLAHAYSGHVGLIAAWIDEQVRSSNPGFAGAVRRERPGREA